MGYPVKSVVSHSGGIIRLYDTDRLPLEQQMELKRKKYRKDFRWGLIFTLIMIIISSVFVLLGIPEAAVLSFILSAGSLLSTALVYSAIPKKEITDFQKKKENIKLTVGSITRSRVFIRPINHPNNKIYAKYYPDNVSRLTHDIQTALDNPVVSPQMRDIIRQLDYVESNYTIDNYPSDKVVVLYNMMVPLIEQAAAARQAELDYILDSNIRRMIE